MPKIDIIIPTYNRANILYDTLKSVQDQTFNDWICWIAEDGKTKETEEVVNSYIEYDKRFRYISCSHSGIPAVVRNRCIIRGNGEYIAFLDDDDLWLPSKLEKQIKFMDQNLFCVLLCSNAYRWKSNDNTWKNSLPLYFDKKKEMQTSYESLVEDNFVINSSAVIRRCVLKESGMLNESGKIKSFEDYEFWLRIGIFGQMHFMPEPLVVYRDMPESSIRNYTKNGSYNEIMVKVFEKALRGSDNLPSPLIIPNNKRYANLCKKRRRTFLLRSKRDMLTGQIKAIIAPIKSLYKTKY